MKHRYEKRIKHTYLIDWKPEDRFMSDVVKSLKGGVIYQPYELMISCLLKEMNGTPIDVVYFPSKGTLDHASMMAKLISKRVGCEAISIKKFDQKKQAWLSRYNRRKQNFERLPLKGDFPLFVDDVLTTGETMRACHKALGQPLNMTVWTLFYRNLL